VTLERDAPVRLEAHALLHEEAALERRVPRILDADPREARVGAADHAVPRHRRPARLQRVDGEARRARIARHRRDLAVGHDAPARDLLDHRGDARERAFLR